MNTSTALIDRSSEVPTCRVAWSYDSGSQQPETHVTSPYERCVGILGDDFISPERIADTYGLVYDEEVMFRLATSMPSESAIQWCQRSGFFLVAGPPRPQSFLDIRASNMSKFYYRRSAWYDKTTQTFARSNLVQTSWLALRKEPVMDSEDLSYPDQIALIRTPVTVPNVAEIIWGLMIYDMVRGVRPEMFIRTSSIDDRGNHVVVDSPIRGGLDLAQNLDHYHSEALGIIAARRF